MTEPIRTITPHHFWGDQVGDCKWCGQRQDHRSHEQNYVDQVLEETASAYPEAAI